jgi:glycosyltransferase involved in cell wall biosynthesis
MTDIAIIAIGRNEGERLRRCLASVVGRGMTVIYVDSASTDGSTALARELGAEVVDLDMSLPFSAARARNEGFAWLMQIASDVRYIQFVDGDCEIVPGWIESAKQTLDSRSEVVVVCGRRRERFPDASIYNRVADIEWNLPIGEALSCGGDSMMRVSAFQKAGGYDASIVAGEEPELCQRLRGAGWKILRIDAEMTLHDSAMLHFAQWWKRSVRSGYGAMDVVTRFGKEGLFRKQVQSARWWGRDWSLVMLFILIGPLLIWLTAMGHGGIGISWKLRLSLQAGIAICWFALLPLQMLRIAISSRKRAGNVKSSIPYGILTMIGKWANLAGQRQYARDRAAGKISRMIDYKSAAKPATRASKEVSVGS